MLNLVCGRLKFLRDAEKLKDTLRSAYTSNGRRESTAEHSWRLCLLAMIFEDQLKYLDFVKVLKLCVLHDLGEALHGDIPAVHQVDLLKKSKRERTDLLQLMQSLDDNLRNNFLQLWDEYEQVSSIEAQVVKAFDKFETIIQHNQGDNPVDFNYLFNLTYGKDQTNISPFFVKIRQTIDEETRKIILQQSNQHKLKKI
ncbi:MAG: HD domain-containing protein [Candidatus Dasytiphilus stammeri]